MIAQFQLLLDSPKNNPQTIIQKTQNLILSALENICPQDYDFTALSTIFSQRYNNDTERLYKLIAYFINTINDNLIGIQDYKRLEEQTQKLEITIRTHIKIQQQMKMYMQHLQYKIQEIQKNKSLFQNKQTANQLYLLKNRENILLKEKINLIKKNQQLSNQLQKKQKMLSARLDNYHFYTEDNYQQQSNGSKFRINTMEQQRYQQIKNKYNQNNGGNKDINGQIYASKNKNKQLEVNPQIRFIGFSDQPKALTYNNQKNINQSKSKTKSILKKYPPFDRNNYDLTQKRSSSGFSSRVTTKMNQNEYLE